MVAAQDQALRTRYYEHHILSVPLAACAVHAGLETVDHIVAGCNAMAPTDYTDRHNQVASIIHWNICRHFQVPVECRWYRHQPDRLVETDDIVVMWPGYDHPHCREDQSQPTGHLSQRQEG